MSALLDLAERCERATGPDRELDADGVRSRYGKMRFVLGALAVFSVFMAVAYGAAGNWDVSAPYILAAAGFYSAMDWCRWARDWRLLMLRWKGIALARAAQSGEG